MINSQMEIAKALGREELQCLSNELKETTMNHNTT